MSINVLSRQQVHQLRDTMPTQSSPPNTILHTDAHGNTVFLTHLDAIGMEYNGRTSVHSIEQWIALSWRDLSAAPMPLALGLGDQSISLRGHPYER